MPDTQEAAAPPSDAPKFSFDVIREPEISGFVPGFPGTRLQPPEPACYEDVIGPLLKIPREAVEHVASWYGLVRPRFLYHEKVACNMIGGSDYLVFEADGYDERARELDPQCAVMSCETTKDGKLIAKIPWTRTQIRDPRTMRIDERKVYMERHRVPAVGLSNLLYELFDEEIDDLWEDAAPPGASPVPVETMVVHEVLEDAIVVEGYAEVEVVEIEEEYEP